CTDEPSPGDGSGGSSGSANGGTATGGAAPSGGVSGSASGGTPSGGTAGTSGGSGTANGGSAPGGAGGAAVSGSGGAAPSGGASGAASGAGGTITAGTSGAAGAGGSAGSAGKGGSAGSVTGGSGGTGGSASGKSGLPVPPGAGNVPRPSGTPGGLTVVDWAGFKSAVSYTFDDSLTSQTQNYATLNATGVRMTFYIVSGNNAMSAVWSMAARDGHEIANHTAHHCHDNGTGCSWGTYAGSLANELTQCTNHITQTFGVSGVYTMAAPFGDPGWATPAQTQFFINRGVAGGQIAPNDATNPFSLPCHVAAMNETAANGFNPTIDSSRNAGRWQILLLHSLGGDGGYNPVATTEVISSINHAKSFGDVWIDSVVNIGAYWRAQKVLSTVTPTTSGTDRTWTWTLPAHFPPGKYLRVRVDGGTLVQGGTALTWDGHGYYEIALDAGSVTLSP
ncbi:MAG TPA: polysaccharide deacetylase family protein, partial [Polyangiaceae bacterium]